MNNESEIASKIRANVNSSSATDESTGINDTAVSDPEFMHNNLPLDSMVLRRTTMEMLGVSNMQMMSTENQDKTNYIIRWALENSQSNEMSDILETISRQIRMMGIIVKEDKLDRLYRYAKLNNQRKAIEIQMRSLNV